MAKVAKIGWRVTEFAEATGLSRVTVYELVRVGRIPAVKNDQGRRGAVIITTSPERYLANLALTAEADDL
jgi:excisionase family DNA binding protein